MLQRNTTPQFPILNVRVNHSNTDKIEKFKGITSRKVNFSFKQLNLYSSFYTFDFFFFVILQKRSKVYRCVFLKVELDFNLSATFLEQNCP